MITILKLIKFDKKKKRTNFGKNWWDEDEQFLVLTAVRKKRTNLGKNWCDDDEQLFLVLTAVKEMSW